MMKKGAKVWCFIVILTVVGLMFSGVIDTTSAISEKTTINVLDSTDWFTMRCHSHEQLNEPLWWWPRQYEETHDYISTYVGGRSRLDGSAYTSVPNCWAKFKPYLSQPGEYEVWAYFYACENTSKKVPFTVKYGGGSRTIKVNQYSSIPAWKEKSLGTWYFEAGQDTYVKVTDATGEPFDNITGLTIGAIKFVKVQTTTVSSPPRNLMVTEVGSGYVKIAWDTPSSDGGSPVTNYKIYRGTSSGAETLYYTTSTAGTTFNNCANIINGVTYYYKAKAVNAVGDSDFSNEVSATPTSGTSVPCFGGQRCYSTKEEVVSHVPTHVVPRDCFVWNDGPPGYPWRPIPGTGCAHWVAHQLGIRRGATCYDGYSIRVSDVIYGRTEVEISSCKVGDIWTYNDRTHCGIVRQLGNGKVWVEHDSSVQGGVVKSWFSLGKCWTLQPNQPPICAIELRMEGAKIDEIDVGEFFDIYVRDSTDDTGISEVCFSSDESQDDNPTGEWTEWYDWDTSSGDWDADTNIKKWSFDTGGAKEVWAEVKDEAGQTSKCSANIYANPLIPQSYAIIAAGEGGHIEKRAIDHSANNAYRVLRNLGFDDDHIFYLNSNRPQDVDGDGDDEIDALASFSNFDNAINEVKDKIEDNPTPFILFLTGHGLPGQFLFDGSLLSDYQLKGMLEEFPSETRMVIFIHSCYSGYFVTSINGISASNRIIITGTHDDQERLWIPWLRSSDRFWGNLNKGLNVKDAFVTGAWPGEWWHLWLNDNGDIIGSSPNDLGEDGNLAARTQIGVPGTENLKLTPWIFVWKRSPGELRVYDSQNQVTGLVNGEVTEEIPDSIYDEQDEIVALFSPSDTYRYEVAGTDEGTYGLDIASIKGAEATTFTATDIPTSTNAIHQYTIDWDALSQGEKGVTVKIDSDGNGVERTIITNNSFQPLIAGFTVSPENPLIGEKVTLDASTSFDLGGGEIKKYRWEFYNAANQDPFYVIEGHDKEIIRYTFTSEGIYLVRLTVTDDEGEYSYTESSITIKELIKEPVFYVPDDYPSIQAAVDAANAGDTIIVRDGTYTENVDIDKSITLKSSSGNQGNTIVQAANPNDHVFEITADYVNIRGFTVGGAAVCIFLNEVNYCNISNNQIFNYTGIYLNYSNDNIIMNNNFSKSDDGILLDSSNSNTVFNNTFSGYSLYSLGIGLKNSTNNLISDNTICNCPHGGIELGFASSNNIILNNTFKSCGLCVWRYEKNTVEGNTVNDKPLIYLENVSQIVVDNAGQVILANCELIKVIGCNLSNATIGIDLLNSSNCVIENNICRDNFCGGIDLHDYSSNNIVLNNIIGNNFWGIFLTSYASNNTIVNNICENNYFGIHLSDTNNNRIYLNNLNNDCNVQSYDSCNIWNSKEKITYTYNGESHTKYLGNYWSDYTGTDANKNGIGDSPYSIDDRGGDIDQDYYPLMTWSEHYFNPPPHPHPLPMPPPTSTLTPSPRPTLTLVPRPTPTLVPRPTPTLAPRPTPTLAPRPTLRPTATLFEKIEGLIAAIRVGVGI